MVFSESPARNLYRAVVWGPYRSAVLRLPAGAEIDCHRKLGRLVARMLPSTRARVERNLARAFPGRTDLAALAVKVLGTHFANQYLPFSFYRLDARNATDYLRVEGLGHLHAAMGEGRGVVLLHPHMGPAQLPLAVLGVLGYPMHQVGGGEVASLSESGRVYAGIRHRLEGQMRGVTLHDGKGYLRPLLRTLSDRGVVLTACDGTGGGLELGRRVVRTVLGHPMKLPVGPAWLAFRSGAALLSLSTFYVPGGHPAYVTVIGPALELPRDLPLDRVLEVGTDLVASFLDRVLREHPEDWHLWDRFEPGAFLASVDDQT